MQSLGKEGLREENVLKEADAGVLQQCQQPIQILKSRVRPECSREDWHLQNTVPRKSTLRAEGDKKGTEQTVCPKPWGQEKPGKVAKSTVVRLSFYGDVLLRII